LAVRKSTPLLPVLTQLAPTPPQLLLPLAQTIQVQLLLELQPLEHLRKLPLRLLPLRKKKRAQRVSMTLKTKTLPLTKMYLWSTVNRLPSVVRISKQLLWKTSKLLRPT
jgi:hypothetical protein